jgi:hypothetical protein
MKRKNFIIAEYASAALAKCADEILVQKISTSQTIINFRLNLSRLSSSIYIIFYWGCVSILERHFKKPFSGIGEDCHG